MAARVKGFAANSHMTEKERKGRRLKNNIPKTYLEGDLNQCNHFATGTSPGDE